MPFPLEIHVMCMMRLKRICSAPVVVHNKRCSLIRSALDLLGGPRKNTKILLVDDEMEAEIQLVTMFAVSEFSSIYPVKCLFDNFTDLVWSIGGRSVENEHFPKNRAKRISILRVSGHVMNTVLATIKS